MTPTNGPLMEEGETVSGTTEAWKPIPGYGMRFEASSLGRIRVASTGRILSQRQPRGYPTVSIHHSGRGATRVHRLVAAAFHGPCPDGMEVRHLDGVRTNNTPSNLAYGTHLENLQDTVRHGTARNAHTGKTHCIRGHEFSDANTRVYAAGTKRGCLTCERLRSTAKRDGVKLSKPPTPRNPNPVYS